MNSPVFADAGYWIALTSGSDVLHERALSVSAELRGRAIVTTEMVLTEYLDGSSNAGNFRRAAAAGFVRGLEQTGAVHIIPMSHELFDAALSLYERAATRSGA